MRVVKPMRLGLLHRVFEDAGKPILTVSVLSYFAFGHRRRLLHEVPMWKAAATHMGEDTPIDLAMPKTRGELIVAGKACVVGAPQPGTNVRVKLAAPSSAPGGAPTTLLEKELYVFGERRWEVSGMTKPVPFNEMPITWSRAFGGEGFAKNPAGRGLAPVDDIQWLPNVEDPKRLIRSPNDKPEPVGLMPMDQTVPARASRTGTYDGKWQKTRFPWFPEDFDWEFFNVAPEDQRIDGFFSGEEEFTIEGMNLEKRVVSGKLPEAVARIFVVRRAEPDRLVELESHIDTVILFPNAERGVAIHRASIAVSEDDAHDVTHVLGAFEDPAAPRKSAQHYLDVLKKREDREKAAMYALRDKDLLPDWPKDGAPLPEDKWSDHPELVKSEELMKAYMERKADAVYEQAKVIAEEQRPKGPGAPEPPALADKRPTVDLKPPPEDLDELADYFEEVLAFADDKQKELEKIRDDAYAQARAQLAEQGLDFDAVVEQSKGKGGGPPHELRAAVQIKRLEDQAALGRVAGMDVRQIEAQLASPDLRARLEQMERTVFEAYRTYTHFYPPAEPVSAEVKKARRAELVAARAEGRSLRGLDLTHADLSGLDLSGLDLEEGLLEGADLKGASLAGANLKKATLARADLRGANLTGADITAGNLSQTKLDGAVLDDAKIGDVWLWEAELSGASMKRVRLSGNALFGARVGAVDFSGATFELLNVLEMDFTGAKLTGATIKLTSVLKSKFDGADFSEAKLQQVGFLECTGERAVFERAQIERVVFALGSNFSEARFVEAKLKHSSLRACCFSGCDFTKAVLDECDFGETDLTRAKLYRASAQQSIFARTDLREADLKSANLTNALFGKAKVHGADLRGANLFRADMAKVRGDDRTNLKDAYVAQVRVVPEPDQPKVLP